MARYGGKHTPFRRKGASQRVAAGRTMQRKASFRGKKGRNH